MISERLGSYEIVAKLGEGGMGEVYRAHDTKLGRDVAIKVLPSSLLADPDRHARFEREARLLASLNHPNIAQIYGLEGLEGQEGPEGQSGPAGSFIVMEFVEGETLDARLKARASHGLPLTETIGVARQIADALDAAHERGIVHRDLKPQNIIVTPDGVVKVLDFGLAKAVAGEAGRAGEEFSHSPTVLAPTMAGVLLGTAPYMSPEQARGRTVDKRTDIWAFGCVLYEMLTGRRAFEGETMSDTIAAILDREPDWSALPPHTPSGVIALLRGCLHKDIRRRLRDIGDGRSTLDNDVPVADPAAGTVTARTVPVRAAWLVAAVLIGAAAAYGVGALRSRPSAGPTVSRVVRLVTGPAYDHSPAISPDGKWIAYLSDARGVTDVWVKVIAGGDPINLTAQTNVDVTAQVDSGGPAISPDGTLISFNASLRGAPGGNAAIGTWVIPAPLGGTPRRVLDVGRGARWSPDGSRLTFVVQGGTGGDAIWIADADGANPREVAPKRGGMHKHWAAWSHDNRYVYFIYTVSPTNAEPSEIYRVPAAGGPVEPVVASIRRAVFPSLAADGSGLVFAGNPNTVDLGLWWKPLAGGAARRLTAGVGEYAQPVLTPDGSRIVASLMDTRESIVRLPAVSDISSDRITTITSGNTGDLDPTLSADGQHLVFSSTRSGTRSLWTARADGGEARPLTSGESIDERPAFSPDGRQIAFVSDRGGARGIWLMNAEGGSPRLLTKAPVLDGISWSRDGRQLAFAVPGDAAPRLSVADVATGAVRPLPTPGPVSYPAWSPTSDVIAYLEARPNPNAPATVSVQFVDSDGGRPTLPIPQLPDIGNSLLAWRPDGGALAVVSNSGSLPSVAWIVEPGNPTAKHRLVEFPADTRIRGVTWSRDGSSLIIGRQSRGSDIVLMDLAK